MAEQARTMTGEEEQPTLLVGACTNCRKLKKCETDPGQSKCVRCLRVDRDCVRVGPPRTKLQPGQKTTQRVSNSHAGEDNVAAGPSNRSRIDGQNRAGSNVSGSGSYNSPYSARPTPSLPIRAGSNRSPTFSGVPVPVADASPSDSDNKNTIIVNQQPPTKRRRTSGHSPGARDESGASLKHMEALFKMFQDELLEFIPIFGLEDFFEDFSTMLAEQKPLVQCICYVTARFVAEGDAIRDKLSKPISDLLLSKTTISTTSQSLALFQGLIVLYAYAPAVPAATEGSQSHSKGLLYRSIKSFTEDYAKELSPHRAIDGLRAAIARRDPQLKISSLYSYKVYINWLWLYTMSHYGSLATRTAPSIRTDPSIRAAPRLLNEIGMNKQVSRLVGEVELCLSWEQASTEKTELGEWWCQPKPQIGGGLVDEDSLDRTQEALNRWTNRWSVLIASKARQESDLDLKEFHIRFVQFCIITYSIRPLKFNEHGTDSLLPAQKEAIAKCVEAASHVLKWALDLGPVTKNRLRYLCDFDFVMLSFCAFFTLRAFQAFGPAIPDSDEHLATVTGVSKVMTFVQIDSKHAPAEWGRLIMDFLTRVRSPEARQSQPEIPRSMIWIMSDADDVIGHASTSSAPEQTWDFSSLFPAFLEILAK